MANKCQDIYEHYLGNVLMLKNNLLNEEVCLYCMTQLESDKMKICELCNSVYFCNIECEKLALHIHQFDCK